MSLQTQNLNSRFGGTRVGLGLCLFLLMVVSEAGEDTQAELQLNDHIVRPSPISNLRGKSTTAVCLRVGRKMLA